MARIWITRAEPGATQTADRVAAMGHAPDVRPVLTVRPLPDLDAPPSDAAGLVFTSLNGVAVFDALLRHLGGSTSSVRGLPVFAVGDATAQAARAVGFTKVESAAGDLPALAALIARRWSTADGLLLAVGAKQPAGDLPAMVKSRANVRDWPVYEARVTSVPAPEVFDAVLVHSPRAGAAVAIGAGLAPDSCRGRVAVAISEAAARPLASLGFDAVHIAAEPTEKGMLEALGKARLAV